MRVSAVRRVFQLLMMPPLCESMEAVGVLLSGYSDETLVLSLS